MDLRFLRTMVEDHARARARFPSCVRACVRACVSAMMTRHRSARDANGRVIKKNEAARDDERAVLDKRSPALH
jgi:hypothetical protein